MTEVLLRELSNADLNWMRSVGRQQQLAAGNVLIQRQNPVDALYIILNGTLTATITSDQESALGKAFGALEEAKDLEQEIGRFGDGEVVGETTFLNANLSAATITAVEAATVLAVPRQTLLDQLQQDPHFGARFYRAIATLLAERFERLLKQFAQRKGLQVQPLQDGPLIFGELSDSDVDWLINHGRAEMIGTGEVLLRAGRPVESLYVMLQGTLSIAATEERRGALSRVFSMLETDNGAEASPGREIARASQGELVGEVALFDTRLSNSTVSALESSMVLAIPRSQLQIKLQQDPGMAARFYRMLVLLLSQRLEGLINRLGYGKKTYRKGGSLRSDVRYEDEIDLDMMDNVTLGGARFDWMLKRLRAGGV